MNCILRGFTGIQLNYSAMTFQQCTSAIVIKWNELKCRIKDGNKENHPSGRYGHTLNIVGTTNLVLFGGLNISEGNCINDMFVLTLSETNNEWQRISYQSPTDQVPMGRWKHSATKVSVSEILVYGGWTGNDSQCLNDLWLFNCATNTWKSKNIPSTTYRASHTACLVDRSIVIFGGVGGTSSKSKTYLNDLSILNLDEWEWKQVRTS